MEVRGYPGSGRVENIPKPKAAWMRVARLLTTFASRSGKARSNSDLPTWKNKREKHVHEGSDFKREAEMQVGLRVGQRDILPASFRREVEANVGREIEPVGSWVTNRKDGIAAAGFPESPQVRWREIRCK